MKVKKLLIPLLLLISCMFAFTACTDEQPDPYKDYKASGLEAKRIPSIYDDEDTYTFGFNKVVIFTLEDYESYAAYHFNLDYTESYFELNNLVIFNTTACSSDEMEFGEILENDGKLYPLFYRKKIAAGQPVTEDFIVMAYCVEIPKDSEYKVGEIIYRYKNEQPIGASEATMHGVSGTIRDESKPDDSLLNKQSEHKNVTSLSWAKHILWK